MDGETKVHLANVFSLGTQPICNEGFPVHIQGTLTYDGALFLRMRHDLYLYTPFIRNFQPKPSKLRCYKHLNYSPMLMQ